MKNPIFVFMILFLYSSCVYEKSEGAIEIVDIDLKDIIHFADDITPSYTGDFTFIVVDHKLLRINNTTNEEYSIELEVGAGFNIDLLLGEETIALLCYNSLTAYDEGLVKNILFFEFDKELNEVSRDTIRSLKGTLLVTDRFRYISYFRDGSEYSFNDEYGYVMKVNNLIWDERKIQKGFIDISNGEVINVEGNDLGEIVFKSENKVIYVQKESDTPSQFSINKGKLAYKIKDKTIIIDIKKKETISLNQDVNPIHLFKDGYYNIKENYLSMIKTNF